VKLEAVRCRRARSGCRRRLARREVDRVGAVCEQETANVVQAERLPPARAGQLREGERVAVGEGG
jgi:hypothetical protein